MNKHKTSMLPEQRKELIRILRVFHKIEDLAGLNDEQLHLQWACDCQYEPAEKAPLK